MAAREPSRAGEQPRGGSANKEAGTGARPVMHQMHRDRKAGTRETWRAVGKDSLYVQ